MNFILMHGTDPVLSMNFYVEFGALLSEIKVFTPELVPVGVDVFNDEADYSGLNLWWTMRSIPSTRIGLRDALEVMKVRTSGALAIQCNGLSLTDCYWIKTKNSNLRWRDINFFNNTFSDDVGDILFGKIPENDGFNLMSPDNTTDGRLRKKWKIIDGKRCLIKSDQVYFQQPYNEVIASEIMRRLDIPHVPYSLTFIGGYPHSVCENFVATGTELVSAWQIMLSRKMEDNVSSYDHFLNCCETLGIPGAKESLDKMLTMDYIIVNRDRHFSNFGALRRADTLEWIGLAPVFDSGSSLWNNLPTCVIRPYDKTECKPFRKKHEDQIELVDDFNWLDFHALEGIGEAFRDILSTASFGPEFDSRHDILSQGLSKRVEMLERYVDSGRRNVKSL
jgi:hypothetical protein